MASVEQYWHDLGVIHSPKGCDICFELKRQIEIDEELA